MARSSRDMQYSVLLQQCVFIRRLDPTLLHVQVSTPGVEAAAQVMVAEADALAALARATRPDLLVQVWPWDA